MRHTISRRNMLKMMGAAGSLPFLGGLSGLASRAFAQSDVSGAFTYWQVPPETPIETEQYDAFFAGFREAYPNVNLTNETIGYGDMLDTLRVAVRGGGGPQVAVLPILWGVEFAAAGFLRPLTPEDLGYTDATFWPKALASNRWQGETYGVPTNNETMAFIYNQQLFEDAGLDPNSPPATWEQVVEFSNQIHTNLGISGFGMVSRLNHGNTPFRFMPVLWAHGGSALDETDDNPTYQEIRINTPESRAAMQVYYDMYVRDGSVPNSALDNSQTENRELFLAGQVAMMISHPTEYNIIVQNAPDLAESVQYTLIPEGPVRRAVVFGGSNIHILSTTTDEQLEAVREFIRFRTNPEWSNRMAWFSNPGNLEGFDDEWWQTRSEQIRFLDVGTAMLEHGIAFPVVPEATEIMNLIVPTMLHNFLTETMTIEEAAADAEVKIQEVLARSAATS